MKVKSKISEYNTTVYNIPKTTKHPKILLHDFEVDLLEQALKYTYWRSVELVDYFVVIRERAGFVVDDAIRARKNVSRRLYRFKESGILRSNDLSDCKGGNLMYNRIYYTFTARTLDVLHSLNRISDDELAYYTIILNKNKHFKAPTLHSTAITNLGTRLDLQLKNTLDKEDFILCKGSNHSIFKNYTDNEGQVFPDLVLEFPDLKKILIFEVDGGKQLRDVIVNKYFRYKKLFNSEFAQQNKREAHLIFLPIDGELINDENRSSKSLRMKYLKNCIPEFTKWGENLNVFTIRYRAIGEFVNRTLTLSEQLKGYALKTTINQWLYNLESALIPLNYKVTVLSEQDLLPQAEQTEYSPNAVINLKQSNKKDKNYFVLYMNNGDIKSQQRYLETCRRLKAINESDFNDLHINLLLLYSTRQSRETDSLDDIATSDDLQIFATSEEEWRELATAENIEKIELPLYAQNSKLLSYTLRKENYRL